MRKRIELYIGALLADIGAQEIILFNYATEDVTKPTAVKNSYSQQLKLAGTAQNGRIFQMYFRGDATPGAAFNPSARVPFQIFADGGTLLEAGYCKLDSASNKGGTVEYKVTLYGQLGALLYALQGNDDGALTLADLDYLGTADPAAEMDFTITRAAVAEAWQQLRNGGDAVPLWNVLNFAPCYNGIPDNFDASHGLCVAADNGLETDVEKEDVHYKPRQGFALVDLGQDVDEWAAKDLRSYHQRPVLAVPGIFEGIRRAVEAAGYSLALDADFFAAANPYFAKAWLTLKQLTKLTLPVSHGEHDVITIHNVASLEWQVYGGLALGVHGTTRITLTVQTATLQTARTQGEVLNWYGFSNAGIQDARAVRAVALQAVAYDEADNALAGSPVTIIGPSNGGPWTAEDMARTCGFTPHFTNLETLWGDYVGGAWEVGADGVTLEWTGTNGLTLTIPDTARVKYVKLYTDRLQYDSNHTGPWGEVYPNGVADDGVPTTVGPYLKAAFVYDYDTFAEVRSGASINKALLLGSTMSPAEFLLAYCKRYGLHLWVDTALKVLHVDTRAAFYDHSAPLDIEDRIDRSREFKVTPVPFDARVYEFKEDGVGAGFEKDYKSKYGHEYGAKRVNTGYGFNADTKQLLEGSQFKTAPEVKGRAVTNVRITAPARPPVFLLGGCTYVLWSDAGELSDEIPAPVVPASATLEYYDDIYKGYDAMSRPQLCDGEGKGVDGDGVLLFFNGDYSRKYRDTAISDDLPAMFLNERDKPCWVLKSVDAFGPYVYPPNFTRHIYGNYDNTIVTETLDFATPLEVDIPAIEFMANRDVYALFWGAYIGDRYSPGTKVVECYVNFNGMGAGLAALRRFYWFDGAVWALNKISSYSLNGPGPFKCEFVQVQSITDYQ